MKKTFFILVVMMTLCGFSYSALSVPVIKAISPASVKAGQHVRISGSGFSTQHQQSEVIASYGQGLSYALKIESWSDNAIKVRVPDLGKRLNLTLQVKTAQGSSGKKKLRLIPEIIREKSQTYQHNLKVGDKGEDLYYLKNSSASCRQPGSLFVDAEVKVTKQRFSEAQVVSTPAEFCMKCKPIKVRWFNEPTGYIRYHFEVKKRVVEGVCPDRQRK